MNGYRAKLLQGKLLKGTKGSSGYDMFATEDVVIYPNESKAISTGVFIEITEGYEGQVRGRSGLNFKHDIFCPTGTIDSDYRNEVKVKLYNFGKEKFIINKGDRIAQLIINKYYEIVDAEIADVIREDGFGHTGK
ncbi:MAG: dUTP diphosphatase [Paraclostridium sp.]